MIVMWGIWQCFFQAPLELVFAFSGAVKGTPRNLFLFCENIFEIALLVDALVEPQFTPKINTIISVVTVLAMTLVLIFARDPTSSETQPDKGGEIEVKTKIDVHQGRPVSPHAHHEPLLA